MDVLRFQQKEGDYTILIRTDSIDYSWRRFQSRIDQQGDRTSMRYCDYSTTDEGTLELANCNEPITVGKEWKELPPVIFETNKYQITIVFPEVEGMPRVIHRKKEVEDFFFFDKDAGGGKGGKLTGEVNFLNEPGTFKLEFEYMRQGRNHHATLTFDIVSPKLDTKKDYKKILAEVNEEYENIIFRYLATTFQQLQARGKVNSDEIWIQRFEDIVDRYIKAVALIVHKPHFKSQEYTAWQHADRVKRWTPQMCEEYREVEALGKDKLERHFFAYKELDTTINTLENRFVKYTLEKIGVRLETVLVKIINNPSRKDPAQNNNEQLSDSKKQKLKEYLQRLRQLRSHAFFKTVGRFEGLKQESLVLQNRTGYVQIYKSWILLKRGIDLYNGVANIGTLQIWEIYELWCFVKMKRLVKDVMKCEAEDVEEQKETLLNPFTSSKVEHVVKYYYPGTNHQGPYVTLHYQHTYNRYKDEQHTATTEQRPDIVLNIERPDEHITLTYLYDAKYRVADDFDKDNDQDQLADYPVPDAINQMHRYRDAIYYGSNYQEHIAKEVIGGYILFPGRGSNERVMERYYWKSIGQVNIGAFPLLPNEENSLLKEHLEDILIKKTKIEQIRNAKPQRGLHYAEERLPTDGMFLVATIPDGRHKITEGQDNFKTGKAKTFRSQWNDYGKINVNSIKYFAPIVDKEICIFYEVTGVFPIIEKGVAWMQYELGTCFSTNTIIKCTINENVVLLRTTTEFYSDMGQGQIIYKPKQKLTKEEDLFD